MMTHGSLFSGIGGFDLAAEWAGFENVFQVEIDKYCQMVLAKNFPNVKRYKDIREFDGQEYRRTIDVISGGFPCQPYSIAGKQRGAEDDRNLWPEMFRVIKEIRPTWVIGENVANIVNFVEFENMLLDLESEGYEVQAFIIPAAAVDAPHRRDRVWIIAHNDQFDRHNSGLRAFKVSQFESPSLFEDVADTESREDNRRERRNMAEETSRGQCFNPAVDFGCADVADADETGRREQRRAEPVASEHAAAECAGENVAGQWWTTEPNVGRTFDGFSSFLDGFNLTFESHKCILAYVINLNGDYNDEEAIARAKKELSTLWCKIDSEVLRPEIGGYGDVQKKKILLAYLCELKNSFDKTWVQLEGKKILKGLLRSLSCKNKPSGTPLGSGHIEQRSIKYPNTLQEVSRLLAQHSEEAWIRYCGENAKFISPWDGDWEKGVMRVADGVPSRVDRLKALGNAVVPQVAYRLFKTIKLAEEL